MKLAKLFVTFGAMVSLVACNNGQDNSVSSKKFGEAVDALEKHQYQSAYGKLSYSCKYTFKGMSDEEIEYYRNYGMIDRDITTEASFYWDAASEEWFTYSSDPNASMLSDVIGVSVVAAYAEYEYATSGVKFYLNPMKIVSNISGPEGQYYKGTLVFDKYGYLTVEKGTNYIKQLELSGSKSIFVKTTFDFTATYSDVALGE